MFKHQDFNSRGNYHFDLHFYNNITFPAHFHRNFELIHVSDGEIIVTINGTQTVVKPDNYAMILSNQIHALHSEKPSQSWIFVFSEEYVPKFATYIKSLQGETATFRCRPEVNVFIQAELANSDSSVMMKKACLYAVCDEYIRQTHFVDRRANDNRIGSILDFISEHFLENITLKTISQQFGYEYHYLSRLLNQEFKINFPKLINEYRIEFAKGLLEENNLNMTDIAMKSGFQSIRGFNYVFKSLTGRTPKEYRESNMSYEVKNPKIRDVSNELQLR